MTSPLLELMDLTRVYFPSTPDENRALDGVTASFEPGKLHVLWGPSGSGKTTLLSLLGALDHPTSGEIHHRGRCLGKMTEPQLSRYRRDGVGILFQTANLLPGVTVWANVSLPLVPDGYTNAQRRERAKACLGSVGLQDKLDRMPHQLSGGEAHRVALARALVRNPQILLVDEPTSQLDAANAHRVIEILLSLVESGRTVIVATHDRDVLNLAGAVIRLEGGRLIPDGALTPMEQETQPPPPEEVAN